MDLKSYQLWEEYSKAKDEMFDYTDIKQSPWFVVNSDNKKKARLNCISHLLSLVPYKYIPSDEIDLPVRNESKGYVRPPMEDQTFIPELF